MIIIQQTANAWGKGKEGRRKVSKCRSGSRGKRQYILHTSRHRKLHAVKEFSVQLLERVVLLLLLHIEIFDQIRYVVVVVFRSAGAGPLLSLLNCLVRLCKFAQRRERVGAELVKNAWDELGKLLDLPSAIDRKCIR